MEQGSISILLIIGSVYVVGQDIWKKTQKEITLVNDQITICTKEYFDNRCSPETRVPMLEQFCNEREACMARDAIETVRSTEAFAKMIADVLNALVSPLEAKTILVLVLLLFGYSLHLAISLEFPKSKLFQIEPSCCAGSLVALDSQISKKPSWRRPKKERNWRKEKGLQDWLRKLAKATCERAHECRLS